MKKFLKQFGGKITKDKLVNYESSVNWTNGKFLNLEETQMDIKLKDVPSLVYKQLFDTNGRTPADPIPIVAFDHSAFMAESNSAKMIWYGHSVLLMRMNGKTILIDPMLGPDASPIAPFSTRRFSENSLDLIDQLPQIDLLIMTHDHYDHLDLASIEKLKGKTAQYFVAIGIGRHLQKWGISEDVITEFDWWDSRPFGGIDITFTPTRHFSGRGTSDRAKSLWGGWAFKSTVENIYFSGDGGYGKHFQEVGKRLVPFDFGIMECGQYNELWHLIHMYPEESIQAAIDAGVKKAMAVHWAGFALALHHWKDPIERFAAEAKKQNFPVSFPRVGDIFKPSDILDDAWWHEID
ncbi:MAG: MBL fold metallo-hydrolase [Cyclobacteriaceae bacterium]